MDNAAQLALLLDRVIDGAGRTSGCRDERGHTRRGGALCRTPPAAARHSIRQSGMPTRSGRVKTADGHRAAWREFAEAGWLGLMAPEAAGGQALPFALGVAVQELFDAACPAFGMLVINARCATRLLERDSDARLRAAWLPKLASGEWGATICISEPQAGSMSAASARRHSRGRGTASGVSPARNAGFPTAITTSRNASVTSQLRGRKARRRERAGFPYISCRTPVRTARAMEFPRRGSKKLGLHGSPTCVMNFEDFEAIPIGPPGRGMPTLFAMIIAMRMSVAAQGAAVAQAASSIAETYARERGQGGRPDAPPTPIETHAEVRRLLLQMRTRAEAARLIALQTAAWIDQGDAGDAAAAARAAMMLPMAKTICAEAATANADAAIQVLGGAGYVKEWPVERMLRDARVFSIYEGTTAI